MIEIKSLDLKQLDVFSKLKESNLFNMGLFVAESKNVIMRAINAGYKPLYLLIEDKLLETSDGKEIIEAIDDAEVYYGDYNLLSSIAGYQLTCGVLCCFKRKENKELNELLKDASRVVVLENVVNPANMGSIFRNAAALNMDCILLTNDCTDPLYKRSTRVSMGNVFNIDYGYIDDIDDVKKYGFKTVGMALRNNTISIEEDLLQKQDKLAILLGSEGPGLKEKTIDNCDFVVKIPMSNNVDSLNVAACSAIAMWQLRKK